MLAGDVASDYWNANQPTDVNNDGYLSPIDALLVINNLVNDGGRPLAPRLAIAGGESGPSAFVDVNNDWHVSPMDALLVINALNAEGELGPNDKVNFEVRMLQPGTNTPIAGLGTSTSDATLSINQEFDLQVRVDDLYTDTGAHGVFSAYLDLLYNPALVDVRRSEIQTITLNGTPESGSFTLTFNGQTTAAIQIADPDPGDPSTFILRGGEQVRQDILAKLYALSNINFGDVYVTLVEPNILPNNPVTQWQVRFAGQFYDSEVNPLTATNNVVGVTSIDITELKFNTPEAFTEAFRSIPLPTPNNSTPDPDDILGIVTGTANTPYQSKLVAIQGADRIDELGAFAEGTSPVGSAIAELVRVRLKTKTTAGVETFTPDFIDQSRPFHDTTVFRDQGEDPLVIGFQAYNGAVSAVTDASSFTASNVAGRPPVEVPKVGDFVFFTSGANTGEQAVVQRQISAYDNATGTFTLSSPLPATPAVGDTFKVFVDLGGSNPTSATLTIVLGPIAAVNDNAAVNEDTAGGVVIDVLGNDTTTPAGGNKVVAAITQPATGGTVTNGGTNVTFTPTANFAGTATFTYEARNTTAGASSPTSTATVTVTVNAVNDAPTINNIGSPAAINEGAGQQTVNLAGIGPGGGADEASQSLTVNVTASPAGVITAPTVNYTTPAATGSINYTPLNGGTATVTVSVQDSGGTSPGVDTTTRTFTVTVNAVNDPPVNNLGGAPIAGTPEVATPFNTAFNFTGTNLLSVADPDANSGQVRVTLSLSPATGNLTATGAGVTGSGSATVTINGTLTALNTALGTLAYNPPAGTNVLSTTLTVATTDNGNTGAGGAKTDNDAIKINVISPNKPFAVGESFNFPEGTTANQTLNVLGNDFVNDGAAATLEAVAPVGTLPTGAAVAIFDNGTAGDKTDDKVLFTPPTTAGFSGQIQFTYTMDETPNTNSSGPSTATVTVNITPVNDAPVAVDDNFGTAVGQALTIPAPGILGNDTDAENNALTVVLPVGAISPANAGTVTVGANGSLTYTPAAGFSGDASFTYQARDNGTPPATSNTGTVKIHVAPPPTANPDTFTTPEDTNLTVPVPGVLTNDVDPDLTPPSNQGLTAVLVANSVSPAGAGTVALNADGSFVFNPANNFNGTATFRYFASAAGRNSAQTTVTINVTSVNDPPATVPDGSVANPLLIVKLIDASFANQPIDVLANDSDPDGPAAALTVSAVTNGAKGTVAISGDGKRVLYTPNAGAEGLDSFTYKASDGTDQSADTLVTVNIVDFVPKTLSGTVFLDPDNNGQIFGGETFSDFNGNGRHDHGEPFIDSVGGLYDQPLIGGVDGSYDAAERRLSGVEIRLSGIDFSGATLQTTLPGGTTVPYLVTFTDANGNYSFPGLKPPKAGTNYTVKEIQPGLLVDGKDVENSPLASTPNPQNDTFLVNWPITDRSGPLANLNFAERGLDTSALGDITMPEDTAKAGDQGFWALTDLNGNTLWFFALPGTWEFLTSVKITFNKNILPTLETAHLTTNYATANGVNGQNGGGSKTIEIHQDPADNTQSYYPPGATDANPNHIGPRFRVYGTGNFRLFRIDGGSNEFGLFVD